MGIEKASAEGNYTLRFPFRLAPGQEVSGLEQPVEHKLNNLVLRLEHRDPFYVFSVQGFDSEESAKGFVSRLWAGLMWVLLNRMVAFDALLEVDTITHIEYPEEAAKNLSRGFGLSIEGQVDGLANDNLPIVYPSDKQIRTITVGEPNVIASNDYEQLYPLLSEGILAYDGSRITANPKLRTALELYSAYFYEQSANAKFLTLIMVLETLTGSHPKHEVALELLTQWRSQVEERKSQLHPSSEEHEALEALERELLFRREASLRSQIRTLVRNTLTTAGNPDASRYAQRAVKAYDRRSTLVHEGTLSAGVLREATRDAREIVEAVLKAKFGSAGSRSVEHT